MVNCDICNGKICDKEECTGGCIIFDKAEQKCWGVQIKGRLYNSVNLCKRCKKKEGRDYPFDNLPQKIKIKIMTEKL